MLSVVTNNQRVRSVSRPVSDCVPGIRTPDAHARVVIRAERSRSLTCSERLWSSARPCHRPGLSDGEPRNTKHISLVVGSRAAGALRGGLSRNALRAKASQVLAMVLTRRSVSGGAGELKMALISTHSENGASETTELGRRSRDATPARSRCLSETTRHDGPIDGQPTSYRANWSSSIASACCRRVPSDRPLASRISSWVIASSWSTNGRPASSRP
jgi:hypothetical protein